MASESEIYDLKGEIQKLLQQAANRIHKKVIGQHECYDDIGNGITLLSINIRDDFFVNLQASIIPTKVIEDGIRALHS